MICPNCKNEIEEGIKFCGSCGTPVPAPVAEPVAESAEPVTTVYCPKCAQVNTLGDRFCMKCGNNLEGVPASAVAPVIEEKPNTMDQVGEFAKEGAKLAGDLAKKGAKEAKKVADKAAKEAKKAADKATKMAQDALGDEVTQKIKKLPKPVLFAGLGVAAVLVIVVVILLISLIAGGGNADYSMYLKDMEIYYSDFSKDEPKEITTRLVDDGDLDEEELAEYGYVLGMFVAVRDDGNRIFYPDKVGEGMDLYYRDLDKPKKDPVKVDSDITLYAADDAGKKLVYLKGEDGDLYFNDLEEKNKLATEVRTFYITDDMKTVLILDEDFNVYSINVADGEKEKVVGEIDSLRYVNEDLTEIFYIKDDSLYKQPVGGDREKIASDVDTVVSILDSGEVYYVTSETYEVNMMDYVNDDMASTDANIFEPEYPTYPSSPSKPYSWKYDTTEEYEAAYAEYEIAYDEYLAECARLEEEYNAAYDLYWEKEDREWLRENLAERTEELTDYTLHYYDGTESVEVLVNLTSKYSTSSSTDGDVQIFGAYDRGEVSKVKLSEIESAYDVSEMLWEARNAEAVSYIVSGATATAIDLEEASWLRLSSDGKSLYYMELYPDKSASSNNAVAEESDGEAEEVVVYKNEGDLYEVAIKKDGLGEPKLIDGDVYSEYLRFLEDGKVVYYKNVDESDEVGDLFVSGTEVDYDVYMYNVVESEEMGGLVYFTDWNENKEYGTMKFFNGKESQKLEDDVHAFGFTPEGELYYMYDYSLNHYTGSLFLYKKNGSVKIDEDVVTVLYINNATDRIRGYNWY